MALTALFLPYDDFVGLNRGACLGIHRYRLHRGADKSLTFRIYSTTERFFLAWVKKVRTTKS
jgi:hypothetical protein